MGVFLVLFSLVAFVLAIIALIRGHLDWARIPTRRVGLFVLIGSLVGFVIGGALTPQPPQTTPAAGPATPADGSPTATSSPSPTAAPSGPVHGAPADVQGPFQVLEVVDGDTYRIAHPEGTWTLRLIGIDTPETRDPDRPVECFGQEATQAAQQLVGSKTVWLHGDPTQDALDRHGRQLVYVWLADGTLVNEKLIRDGFAVEYTYQKVYQHQQAFRVAQEEARQADRGIWAASTCNGNADLPAQQPTTQAPPPRTTQAPPPPTTQPPPPRTTQAPPPRTTQAPPPRTTQPPSDGGAVYYKNCDEARAAGAAPIQRGEPGYRSGLDRDSDGIACDQ